MSILGALIPVSLFLGGLGLMAFLWCVRTGQFDDPEGDPYRALFNERDAPEDDPVPPSSPVTRTPPDA